MEFSIEKRLINLYFKKLLYVSIYNHILLNSIYRMTKNKKHKREELKKMRSDAYEQNMNKPTKILIATANAITRTYEIQNICMRQHIKCYKVRKK